PEYSLSPFPRAKPNLSIRTLLSFFSPAGSSLWAARPSSSLFSRRHRAIRKRVGWCVTISCSLANSRALTYAGIDPPRPDRRASRGLGGILGRLEVAYGHNSYRRHIVATILSGK